MLLWKSKHSLRTPLCLSALLTILSNKHYKLINTHGLPPENVAIYTLIFINCQLPSFVISRLTNAIMSSVPKWPCIYQIRIIFKFSCDALLRTSTHGCASAGQQELTYICSVRRLDLVWKTNQVRWIIRKSEETETETETD